MRTRAKPSAAFSDRERHLLDILQGIVVAVLFSWALGIFGSLGERLVSIGSCIVVVLVLSFCATFVFWLVSMCISVTLDVRRRSTPYLCLWVLRWPSLASFGIAAFVAIGAFIRGDLSSDVLCPAHIALWAREAVWATEATVTVAYVVWTSYGAARALRGIAAKHLEYDVLLQKLQAVPAQSAVDRDVLDNTDPYTLELRQDDVHYLSIATIRDIYTRCCQRLGFSAGLEPRLFLTPSSPHGSVLGSGYHYSLRHGDFIIIDINNIDRIITIMQNNDSASMERIESEWACAIKAIEFSMYHELMHARLSMIYRYAFIHLSLIDTLLWVFVPSSALFFWAGAMKAELGLLEECACDEAGIDAIELDFKISHREMGDLWKRDFVKDLLLAVIDNVNAIIDNPCASFDATRAFTSEIEERLHRLADPPPSNRTTLTRVIPAGALLITLSLALIIADQAVRGMSEGRGQNEIVAKPTRQKKRNDKPQKSPQAMRSSQINTTHGSEPTSAQIPPLVTRFIVGSEVMGNSSKNFAALLEKQMTKKGLDADGVSTQSGTEGFFIPSVLQM